MRVGFGWSLVKAPEFGPEGSPARFWARGCFCDDWLRRYMWRPFDAMSDSSSHRCSLPREPCSAGISSPRFASPGVAALLPLARYIATSQLDELCDGARVQSLSAAQAPFPQDGCVRPGCQPCWPPRGWVFFSGLRSPGGPLCSFGHHRPTFVARSSSFVSFMVCVGAQVAESLKGPWEDQFLSCDEL